MTSSIPKSRPPSTAPVTLPMPPSTAAMKAFSPGRMPMKGLTWGYFMAHSSPAGPGQERAQQEGKGDDAVDVDAHEADQSPGPGRWPAWPGPLRCGR